MSASPGEPSLALPGLADLVETLRAGEPPPEELENVAWLRFSAPDQCGEEAERPELPSIEAA